MSAVIDSIVSQHAEEAISLWWLHRDAVVAPQFGIRELRRLHDRIEAHVDGLRIAGDAGLGACMSQLAHEIPEACSL